jgi:predicted transcriptional regulator YheO
METIANPALRPYAPIVDGIADTFGSNCEVVLHDLAHPKTSVVYVRNGHVTDRKVGDGIRDLVLDVLRSPDFQEDALTNYESSVVKGKSIKSTTIVIRDAKQKVIGALCINFDITCMNLIKSTINELASVGSPSAARDQDMEIENADVLDILNHIISHTIAESGKLPENMKKDDFLKIIKFMDEKGVFLIKNSVDWVARKLNLSKFTIYGYLKEIRIDKEIQKR